MNIFEKKLFNSFENEVSCLFYKPSFTEHEIPYQYFKPVLLRREKATPLPIESVACDPKEEFPFYPIHLHREKATSKLKTYSPILCYNRKLSFL